MSPDDCAKNACALAAVTEYFTPAITSVGVGSGSTIEFAVKHMADALKTPKFKNASIAFVPSSFQARQLIVKYALPLASLDTHPDLDLGIDGADEVDLEHDLALIKGGGGCHLQEKVVASRCRVFVVVADQRKKSQKLGTSWTKGVPLEVVPFAYVPVLKALESIGGAPIVRPSGGSKAGPCVSDNGNFIVDCVLDISDAQNLEKKLHAIPGIVETGLFVDYADACIIGLPDGSTETFLLGPDAKRAKIK